MNPAPTPAAVVGLSDHAAFREGWHERQRDGRCGIPYRATRERADLELARVPGATRLAILLSAPVDLLGAPAAGTVEIEAAGAIATEPLRLGRDAWVLRRIALPPGGGATLRVRFIADRVLVPDTVLHNGDGRRLGWFVSAVWQE